MIIISAADDMNFSNMKRTAVFAIALICTCAAIVCAADAVVDSEPAPLFNTDSPTDKPFNPETGSDGFGSALYRMIIAVAMVILLGMAAIYASKKVMPRFSVAQGKKIKVIETIHLGSRKTIHLLEVENQQILIGSTPDRITKLADIFSEKGFPLNQPSQREVE